MKSKILKNWFIIIISIFLVLGGAQSVKAAGGCTMMSNSNIDSCLAPNFETARPSDCGVKCYKCSGGEGRWLIIEGDAGDCVLASESECANQGLFCCCPSISAIQSKTIDQIPTTCAGDVCTNAELEKQLKPRGVSDAGAAGAPDANFNSGAYNFLANTGLDSTAAGTGHANQKLFTNAEGALESGAGSILNTGLSFLGVIFLILLVYGGVLWMTARGNDDQVGNAKDIIVAAIIGLIIVAGAYAVSYFVISSLTSNLVI
jgi:hypothetical protein